MEYIASRIQDLGPLHLVINPSVGGYAALYITSTNNVAAYQHDETYPFKTVNGIDPSTLSSKVVRVHTPFTLLPSAEYEESMKKRIAQEAFTFAQIDHIEHFNFENYVGVYILEKELRSTIIREFGDINMEHVVQSLLAAQRTKDPSLLAHWSQNQLLLVGMKEGLRLANYYTINTPEDSIYYILSSYQLLQMDPLANPLSISGSLTSKSAIFEKLRGFVKNFDWVNENHGLLEAPTFEPHLFYHLMNH